MALSPPLSAQNYVISNGRVWDGQTFTERTLYISEGVFVSQEPSEVDSLIDASGKYITPAFGDFHTHVFDSGFAVAVDSIYRSKGIFFAQDLVNDPVGREQNKAFLTRAETVDVAFANGAITSNYGHPIQGYERMATGIGWPRNQAQRDSVRESRLMENRLYYIIDEQADISPKVEALASTNPDLMKLILWDSQEYEEQAGAAYPVNNQGLNPRLLPEIVERAHELGLRPVAHIESEYDFIQAVRSGIRTFAHAPLYGYGNNGDISEQYPTLSEEVKTVIREAGDLIVNPTLLRTFRNVQYLPENRQPSVENLATLKAFHARLLTDLKESGAVIVAGADFPRLDAMDEVLYYRELGIFSNAELLNMLIETAGMIFPGRQIGSFEEGFEAHVLIFSENPAEDIQHVNSMEMAIKNGLPLSN